MQETPKRGFEKFSPDHHETEYSKVDLDEENRKTLEFIEEITTHADEVQKRVLSDILAKNANVEYLTKHGGHHDSVIIDHETYKKVIPVVSYEDIIPEIHRIANGDKSPILTSQPITEFLTSSGTSGGERKLIPITEEDITRRFTLNSMQMPIMSQFLPGLGKGKGMNFMFIKSAATTPGGLRAQSILTYMYKSNYFLHRKFHPYTNYTCPNDVVLCPDAEQSMYAQLLCGLYHNKDVVWVGAPFASMMIRAIKFLEKEWEDLCRDIRTGSINARITDTNVRDSLGQILEPNPSLADFIEDECQNSPFEGIISRLWPNVKFIQAIATGAMAQYRGTLDYYSDGIPIASPIYVSSECHIGLNLNPIGTQDEVAYTCFPNTAFFEFLPIKEDGDLEAGDYQQLVDLVDVKLGQEYELIVTNYSGLYRYRVGDVVRVAGFKNKVPQLTFVCRRNVGLSVDSDKTSEKELQTAIENTTEHLSKYNISLLDYTSYVDTKTVPAHYVIFWEITQNVKEPTLTIPDSLFEDCCLIMEESLNSVYRQGRASDKSIGPLEIRLVAFAAFDELMEFAVTRGASMTQYKTPRCVKYEPFIELLNSKVISSHFSQKCPTWVPGHKQWYTKGRDK